MNCDSARGQIPLYLYGELTAKQEAALSAHLEGCRECRAALEKEKRLHGLLDAARAALPEELVEECRQALGQTVGGASPAESGSYGGAGRLSHGFRTPPWAAWAAAAALAAAGFFAGRWSAQAGAGAGPGGAETAMEVRYIEPQPGGRVRILVEEKRERVLEGALEDPRVREALLTAVHNPVDPSVRADSVELLKALTWSAEVREALLYALEHDPNDGVRWKALEGLRAHASDPECRRALSRVLLRDRNPGIRSAAIDLLANSADADVVGVFQELLRFEQNDYVRLRSIRALEALGAPVETF